MPTRQCYIPKFKCLSQVVLKKKVCKYVYVFLLFEPRTTWRGHLGPWNLHLNTLGKGPPQNATNQISIFEPSGPGEEEFLCCMYFYGSTVGPS